MIEDISQLAERLMRHEPRVVAPAEGEALLWAAVAVIFQMGMGGPELLFIERATSPEDPWSGHMAFPGGRKDGVDPALITTAVRETREEVSLDLRHHGQVLGQLDDVQAIGRGRRLPLHIRPYVFAIPPDLPLTPDAREVERTLWIPLSFLANPANLGSFEHPFQGEMVTLPAYNFGPHVIWGLTFGMVQSLLHALKAA